MVLVIGLRGSRVFAVVVERERRESGTGPPVYGVSRGRRREDQQPDPEANT